MFAHTLPLSKKTPAWVTRGRCEDCLPEENQAMLIHTDYGRLGFTSDVLQLTSHRLHMTVLGWLDG